MNQEQPVISLSLNMSPELHKKLKKMSLEAHTSETDILKKAIFLLDIAMENKKKGNKVAIVDKEDHKVGDIFGV